MRFHKHIGMFAASRTRGDQNSLLRAYSTSIGVAAGLEADGRINSTPIKGLATKTTAEKKSLGELVNTYSILEIPIKQHPIAWQLCL